MGQQQLLLIVLGVIVVGLSIVVGINLFQENAIEQQRNEVLNECILLAAEAQRHYRRPTVLGGGGNTFNGWDIPSQYAPTIVASFTANITSDQEVIITGIGADLTEVRVVVTKDEYQATIIN
jgi:type II secretory pathway pseudopilin PulG